LLSLSNDESARRLVERFRPVLRYVGKARPSNYRRGSWPVWAELRNGRWQYEYGEVRAWLASCDIASDWALLANTTDFSDPGWRALNRFAGRAGAATNLRKVVALAKPGLASTHAELGLSTDDKRAAP